MVHLIMPD